MSWIVLVMLALSQFVANADQWVARHLTQPKTQKWQLKEKSPLILVFFKSDCIPCREQLEQTQCLEDQFEVKLVGVFSSEPDLKNEYLKMKTSWPAFYGDSQLLQSFGIVAEATPQILLLTKNDRYHHVGLWPCEKLRAKAEELQL